MAGKKEESPEESLNMDDPTISDTREYSDFILFLTRNGRFQANSLLDQERKMGVLNLLKPERVIKLTTDRRATPVNMALTPGGPRQRIYLVAIVRRSVPNEELDDLVERMNAYIEGMTTAEKERTVRDLVYATGSRVMPGVRYLPLFWYEAGEVVPPDELMDEDGRQVDDSGLPILDTEDEVVAVAASKTGPEKRNPRDQSMPRTSAYLSEGSTDSEIGPGTHRKRVKGKTALPTPPPPSTTAHDDEDDVNQHGDDVSPPKKKRVSQSSEVVGDIDEKPDETEVKEEEKAAATADNPVGDSDAGPSSRPASDDLSSVAEVITMEIPDEDMPMTRGEFQKQMQAMKELMSQSLEAQKKSLAVAARDSTPPMYNDAETQIMALFPINIYNEPMNWLLSQSIVQRFIYFDVMRLIYRSHPVFKPEADWVTARYMDYIMSQRLQTHFAKATKVRRRMDYSRVPMPMVLHDIAETHLKDLGKRRTPGAKTMANFMKDRCNSNRRVHLLNSAHVQAAKSKQEMAWLIMAERVDFVEKHDWLTLNQNHNWTFEMELKKTRGLTCADNHKEDPSFDSDQPWPEDIESDIWPSLDKGQTLESMEQAEALVNALEASGVGIPIFPPAVWALIRMRVDPNERDIAMAREANQKKENFRQARLARRREKYQNKKRAAHDPDDDLDLDSDSEHSDESVHDSDDGKAKPKNKGKGPGPAKKSKAQKKAIEKTPQQPTETVPPTDENRDDEEDPVVNEPAGPSSRREVITSLMGNVSDISSSDSGKRSNVEVTTNKDGAMVFTQSEGQGETSEEGLATGQILEKAKASGVATEQDAVIVACDKTATVTTKYSVIVQATQEGVDPTVVSGETEATHSTKETLTKQPEQPKTAMQRYSEMEDDMISQTVMEGGSVRFSSSSSSNDAEQTAPADEPSGNRVDPTIGKEKDLMPPPQESAGIRPRRLPGQQMTTADWSLKPSTSKALHDRDEEDFQEPDAKKRRTRSDKAKEKKSKSGKGKKTSAGKKAKGKK